MMVHQIQWQQQRQQQYDNHSNGSNGLSSSSSSSFKDPTRKFYDLNNLKKLLISPYVLTLFILLSICSITIFLERHDNTRLLIKNMENSSKNEDTIMLRMLSNTNNSEKYENNENNKPKNHRKFISYTSSIWEKLWLLNVKYWENNKLICYAISKQKLFLQEFLNATCTARIPNSDWCLHDDAFQPFWININTLEYNDSRGRENIPKSQPYELNNLPEDKEGSPFIFSKFVFLNEYTGEIYVEYIEPLVSHLRHPLARCNRCYTFDNNYNDSTSNNSINGSRNINGTVDEVSNFKDKFYLLKRSYVIPPTSYQKQQPNHSNNNERKYYYFDAGASSWSEGAGGPSLDYFTKIWSRHNINFDMIEAWEGNAKYDDFDKTVPEVFRNKTIFHNTYIVSSLEEHSRDSSFLPLIIKEKTNIDDYVLFKLDIDNGRVENGIVNHLLQLNDDSVFNDHLDYIDEFVWEHHVEGNYLLKKAWRGSAAKGVSLYDSYQLFLKLRQRGVRAHSWV